jgi:SAM-dependent methyltransferase
MIVSDRERRIKISRAGRSHVDAGDVTGWFEQVYASAEHDPNRIPWDYHAPSPFLRAWLARHEPDGDGRTALVIGSGLGDDAAALAGRGYRVTAFDVAPTAVAWAQARFPKIGFHTADMFAPPAGWVGAFDFVLENRVVQSLPLSVRPQAVASAAQFVAPGGRLLTIASRRPANDTEPKGPPWPLSRAELALFERSLAAETHTLSGNTFVASFIRSGGL